MTLTFKDSAEMMGFKMAAFNAMRQAEREDVRAMRGQEAQQWFENQATQRNFRQELVSPFALFCMNRMLNAV
ncbi:MAG: hypothetical protein KGI27_13995 [Thaumarchaeota archaeon]|nr:hypothetical protein [Nitrososphaerota archaeon]